MHFLGRARDSIDDMRRGCNAVAAASLLRCAIAALILSAAAAAAAAAGSAGRTTQVAGGAAGDAGRRKLREDSSDSPASTSALPPKLKLSSRDCRGRDEAGMGAIYLCTHSLLPTVGAGLPVGAACEKRWPLFFNKTRLAPSVGGSARWGCDAPRQRV
jgi:hypothetical protein